MKLQNIIPVLFLVLPVARICAQDTLIFQKGESFPVKVVRESDTRIQYRKLDVSNSPLYIIERRFVSGIRYQYPDSASLLFKPDTIVYGKELNVWVSHLDQFPESKGILYDINDSTIILRKKTKLFEGRNDMTGEIFAFPYQKIRHLQVRQQKKIRQYAFWGAAIGFVSGYLTGLAVFRDSAPCDSNVINGQPCDSSLASPRSQTEKALLMGIGGAAGGILTGGTLGAIRVRFPIHGRQDQYNAAIPRIKRIARYLED